MTCRAAVQASPDAKLSDLKVACFSAHKYVLDAQVRAPPQGSAEISLDGVARVMRCPVVLFASFTAANYRHELVPPIILRKQLSLCIMRVLNLDTLSVHTGSKQFIDCFAISWHVSNDPASELP